MEAELINLIETGQYFLISASIVLNLYAIGMIMKAVQTIYEA